MSKREDLKYYTARLATERARAEAAKSCEIATVHRELAQLYEQRLRVIDGSYRHNGARD